MARAIEFGNLAVRKAASPADYLWARSALALALCRAGEPGNGLDHLVEAVQEFRKASAYVHSVRFGIMLGENYLQNHQYDETEQELVVTFKLAKEMGMKFDIARCHFLLGKISLKTDPTQQKSPSAKTRFENAVSICREIKTENLLAAAFAGLGRYYKKMGDVAAARDYLNQFFEINARLGNLLVPVQVGEELAQSPEA